MRAYFGLACVIFVVACGGEETPAVVGPDVMHRDLFVETYVQLRMEALDNSPNIITDGEKAEILAEQNISEEDLRIFLDTHGPDLIFMRDLWADIEAQILSLLSQDPDSSEVSG